ncbi:MAG: MazG nucleotide pyrophosphohydrolase domain-containing protein [Microbacteriaceae bacterium]
MSDVPTHPELDELIAVMAKLRGPGGCAWDAEQSHESLVRYLVEESHELIDAIESGDRVGMLEELGDVLYQVLFHADLASAHPDEPFDIEDVARVSRTKMVGRHPHVFGDVTADTAEEVSANWEKWKAAEKPERTNRFEGVPAGLPALQLADKVLGKVDADVRPATIPDSEDDLGELLFAVVAAARSRGFDAERALRNAVRRRMI